MKQEKTVSVIVPVYNGEKTIKRCLESIESQSFKFHQIIIVNNGSTDGTQAILSSYPHYEVIYCPEKGRSKARNAGLKIATSDYVLFLDADIVLSQSASLMIKRAINQDQDCLIGPVIPEESKKFIDKYRHFFKGWVSSNTYLSIFKTGSIAPVVNTACALYKRVSIEGIQHFDEDLERNEDRDLSRRFFYNGGVISADTKFISFSSSTYSGISYLLRSFENGRENKRYNFLWGDQESVFRLAHYLEFFKYSKSLRYPAFLALNQVVKNLGFLMPMKRCQQQDPGVKLKGLFKKNNIMKFSFFREGNVCFLSGRWRFYRIDQAIIFVDINQKRIELSHQETSIFMDFIRSKKLDTDANKLAERLIREGVYREKAY